MPVFTSSTPNSQVPFWMRANQFGSVPLSGFSGSAFVKASKSYDHPDRLMDWGFSVEGRGNAGKNSNAQLIEGYLKGRLYIFQLKAGRSKDITGLVDSSLSIGSFAISGNALGVPKVELSIPDYWDIPGTNKIIAIKGNITHGWLGETRIKRYDRRFLYADAYYHELAVYGRIGKPDWRVRLYGGVNHQVMWGGEDLIYRRFTLSGFDAFKHVVLGQNYKPAASKLGNQLGTIDQAMEYETDNLVFKGYHQFFYDIGALYHLANLKDGLFGLTIRNKYPDDAFGWKKIVVEYFNSKSQAGERDAKVTPSGDEDYYNSYQYINGWEYEGMNLGNPLITSRQYARKELVARDHFMNNRVTAFNVAAQGNIFDYNITAKVTYSRNFGTYATSPIGRSQNGRFYKTRPPYFGEVGQFSGYVEVEREFGNNYHIGAAFALDNGGLLYNSGGGFIRLSKVFL